MLQDLQVGRPGDPASPVPRARGKPRSNGSRLPPLYSLLPLRHCSSHFQGEGRTTNPPAGAIGRPLRVEAGAFKLALM